MSLFKTNDQIVRLVLIPRFWKIFSFSGIAYSNLIPFGLIGIHGKIETGKKFQAD
jgi:hypothetical protein